MDAIGLGRIPGFAVLLMDTGKASTKEAAWLPLLACWLSNQLPSSPENTPNSSRAPSPTRSGGRWATASPLP